ncbi:3-oxoacyl-ACP reductase [Reticulibacter mediterranei]|uniref:3-oxoacyl-ACP reductase n=2 Tax=Reticulibacter mediterranei TaxID=2778369 RepID=A0A8J3J5A5_9CHLR|nr:SDR family oxidoreductase [Reticulibacter mediterranei]GHP00972.1 3-oxoacyl-ACP reductase [Reticulibacter mediterranei]
MQQKTAIVTGASSGIGLGLTRTLLEQGYSVVANARTITITGTLDASERLALVDGDIARQETTTRIVETAIERFGRIDLLVNNAGIFIGKPFTEYTVEDFEQLVGTNLSGFFFLTQQAIHQMQEQQSGHIVNISAAIASQPIAAIPSAVAILTKGALNAATKALALEYAHEGIRVNAIAPGTIDTPLSQKTDRAVLQRLQPMPRIGSVAEIAAAVLYLTEAPFITGEILHIDGGAHAGKW